MFKKKGYLVVLLLVLVSMFFLVGCREEEESAEGEYVGYSTANDSGRVDYVKAEVVVEDGEIIDVELSDYQAESGEPKGEDYGWDEFHEAIEVLPERFVEANDYDVEVVSGATATSESAMEAVGMALQKAAGVSEFDGTYVGMQAIELRGDDNNSVAFVTVEDGEIVEVELKESSEGEYKGEDYDRDDFHEAIEVLPERFVEANDSDIEAVSGATISSEGWMEAVNDALEKAGLR